MFTRFGDGGSDFALLDEFRRRMDRVWDELDTSWTGSSNARVPSSSAWPRLNLYDEGPNLVLKADVDVIPALHHLLGGLRETGLVAVNRRNVEKTGQKKQRAADDEKCNRAGMTADHKIDHALQTPPRILGVYGFARRAKSWSLVSIAHRFRIR